MYEALCISRSMVCCETLYNNIPDYRRHFVDSSRSAFVQVVAHYLPPFGSDCVRDYSKMVRSLAEEYVHVQMYRAVVFIKV